MPSGARRVGSERGSARHFLALHAFQVPLSVSALRASPPLPHIRGGEDRRASSSPRLLSHLAVVRWGRRAAVRFAHLFSYVRPRGRPSGMLPSTASAGHPVVLSHGRHTASRFEGRTSGFITQPRYRRATDPAPACPNVRCASVSPRRQGHYHRGIGGGDKDREDFFWGATSRAG